MTTDTAFLIVPINRKTFFPQFRGKLTKKSLHVYVEKLKSMFDEIGVHVKDIPTVITHLYQQSLRKTKKSLKTVASDKEVKQLHDDLKKMVKFMRSLV